MSKTVAVFSSALLCLLFVSTASLRAQGTPPPDFTGVYSPIDPFGQAGRGRAAGATAGGDSRRAALPERLARSFCRRRDLCWFSMDVRAGRKMRRS